MQKKSVPFLILGFILVLSACKDPVASFTHDCLSCEIDDLIQFTSTSENAETFDWDFGDGTTSTEEHPTHIFNTMGTYTVELKVSNSNGSDGASESLVIKGPSGLRIDTVVYSPGLVGNLLGDSPYRDVSIYLPPNYETSGINYPVVYLLHGYSGDNMLWFGQGYQYINLEPVMNRLINNGTIEPMILVSPDSKNRFGGSWYLNSVSSGNWEDFIVKDVVQFVDANYRTLPDADSRGIAGHSMGGYGTVWIAMTNPDVFGAAYGLSSSILKFSPFQAYDESFWVPMYNASNISDFDNLTRNQQSLISKAIAMNPNLSAPPFYCDFQFSSNGIFLSDVWETAMAFDPYSGITTYKDNLLQLNAFKIECGDEDGNTTANIAFAEKLATIGIEDAFDPYEGDHNNKIPERLEKNVIPFMSENLVHDNKK